MAANGLITLVDAYYLGEYVGADALTAVTLMLPVYMLLVAVSTLVSSGFSSVLARLLGAKSTLDAGNAFSGAIALSQCVSLVFIVVFLIFGEALTLQLANGSQLLARFGYTCISILIFFSPVVFILGISIDTLRCEGQMRAMVTVTLVSTLLNFVFNYLFIVQLDWGVAGSAFGTAAAQICALAVAIQLRRRADSKTDIQFSGISKIRNHWHEFIVLGVPSSLGYVGLSLTAIIILQIWNADTYSGTAGAYGIITRLMTFTFLPLLGLSIALQTIVGNNYGAAEFERSTGALKIAIAIAAVYCVVAQIGFYVFKDTIGFIFVDDTAIAAKIGRILLINTSLFFLFGPMLMVSTYFQSVGEAIKAAILDLYRTFLFAIPLILLLPYVFSQIGIWYAGPTSEIMMLALTVAVLLWARKSSGSYLHAVSNKR
ncbi:MAG: putative MATE family efflux protein [Cryomorphaceae bacterium]|jgi:putative MATE family efflux protein